MRISTRSSAVALALAAVVAVPAASLVTTTAYAADSTAHTDYRGKTTTKVNVRLWPTPKSAKLATLAKGKSVKILCKTDGPTVAGNKRWYNIKLGHTGPDSFQTAYVAARYVKNVGKAPRSCALAKPDGQVVAKPGVKIRTTPSLKAKTVGTIPYGKQIRTLCKVNGPSVDGNKRWYQLRDGTWLPARWVKNLDQRVPQPC